MSIKAKVACFNLMRIGNIRKFLTLEACEILVSGLVTSHLDFFFQFLRDTCPFYGATDTPVFDFW